MGHKLAAILHIFIKASSTDGVAQQVVSPDQRQLASHHRCAVSLMLSLAWRGRANASALGGKSCNTEVLAFMKTQYYTATSLDGFIATEDDSLDWLFPLGDANDTSYPAFIAEVGALAMGSATYEWILRYADKVAAEMGSPWPYAQLAWIFSSRVLPSIEGANTRFVKVICGLFTLK